MGRDELTSDLSFSWFLSPEQLQRQKSIRLARKAPGPSVREGCERAGKEEDVREAVLG